MTITTPRAASSSVESMPENASAESAAMPPTVSIVEPPPHVHERLELSADGLAVARKRVRFIDNRPYALADSYFPQELVTGTPLMEPRDVSAPGGVLASLGL